MSSTLTRKIGCVVLGLGVGGPVGALAQQPAPDSVRGRFMFKADILRQVALSPLPVPLGRVWLRELPWLVSVEYYLSRKHSLQADWLHNGGARPRHVEGATLQWRIHELSFSDTGSDFSSLYYGVLVGYRRLRWDNVPGPYGPVKAKMERASAGLLMGGEVALTKKRPLLTLGMMSAASWQEKTWNNAAFEYDEDMVHGTSTISYDNLNLDVRLTLGICL